MSNEEDSHKRAIALWSAGDVIGAIGLLRRALDDLNPSPEGNCSARVDLLSTLGEILFEQRRLDQALTAYSEAWERHVRQAGANHPNSLAAQGDLAAVLFELGRYDQADRLEAEAFESARTHLGNAHAVTCVLAWNRTRNHERRGDLDSAKQVVVDQLTWLLAANPAGLETDHLIVRSMLSDRLNWENAQAC